MPDWNGILLAVLDTNVLISATLSPLGNAGIIMKAGERSQAHRPLHTPDLRHFPGQHGVTRIVNARTFLNSLAPDA